MDGQTSVWRGSKVRLRAWELDDLPTAMRWMQDSEGARYAWSIPLPESAEALRKRIEEMAQQAEREADDDRDFVIETITGEPAGSGNTFDCERASGNLSYGLYIAPEMRRHGLATEAIQLLLRFYFHERRYVKANANIYDFNEPSIRLHERMGFTLEGRRRLGVYTRGAHHDVLFYGITADEFFEKHAGWLQRHAG